MRILMFAVVSLAAPAVAADTPAGQPVKEKKICRPADTTGSRLGARQVCKTAADWQRQREQTDRDMELRRRSSATN